MVKALHNSGESCIDDLQDWETYVRTRVSATYLDFIELTREIMGHSQKENLRK